MRVIKSAGHSLRILILIVILLLTTYEPLGKEGKPLIMLCRLADGTNVLGPDFKLLSQRMGKELSVSNFLLMDPAAFLKTELQKIPKR